MYITLALGIAGYIDIVNRGFGRSVLGRSNLAAKFMTTNLRNIASGVLDTRVDVDQVSVSGSVHPTIESS